jgi:nucleoside-diphosphate-sugar epimerase
MTTPCRCLITGATGFVGSHLARTLVSDGWLVHILVRTSSSLAAIADIADRLTIHTLTPPNTPTTESVATAVASAKPDIVFHLAAMFRAEHTPEDIAPMVEANVTFTTQLLEGMRLAGVNTIVNTGTSWQHYQDAPYDPVCLYAATKQAAEDIITFYCNAQGFKAITLKLFDTYGSADPRQKLFHLLKNAARTGDPLAMSAGEQLIDLVHVDDVTAAYLIAANRLLTDRVSQHEGYAVSSGRPIPLMKLVQIYAEVTGQCISVTWGARAYREREVMVPWAQGTAIASWSPKIALIDGLRDITKLK